MLFTSGGQNARKLVGKDVKETPFSRFLDFLSRYWIVLVGLMLATPYIFKWLSSLKGAAEVAEAAAQAKAETKKDEVQTQAIIDKAKNNSTQNTVQDVKVNKSKEDEILKNVPNKQIKDRLKAAAKNLAYALGTAADSHFWDVSTWTEDDTKARKILTDNWYYFTQIENLYQYVYTKNSNLKSDLNKLLDNSDFEIAKKYFRSKGSYALG